MTSIEEMITHILLTEGGYVNHPADRGGPTNMGVTQETLSEWRGYWVTEEEVKQLEEQEARKIYRYKYFLNPKLNALPESVQLFSFDSSINHGPSRAIKFIQKVCRKEEIAFLKIDGINGPRTRLAAEKAYRELGGVGFNNKLVGERLAFFYAIVNNDPTQEVFLDGWVNRAEKFWK